ncbi:hypothetical protein PO909_025203 [Leuciscus waleckii]
MEDCVDQVGASKFVSKLDLLKGYWQVPLTTRARELNQIECINIMNSSYANYFPSAFLSLSRDASPEVNRVRQLQFVSSLSWKLLMPQHQCRDDSKPVKRRLDAREETTRRRRYVMP